MLNIEHLTLRYQKKTVLSDLSYSFAEGKITAILGASGIGKTTLLHVISGLLTPSEGRIQSSYERCAYLFQEPRLFPWMTALENVSAVCPDKAKALYFLGRLFPDSDISALYPHELSGGMKQRVSIARALAYAPDLVLMDEPFRGLDAETRLATSDLVFQTLREKTVLLVTHDEADLDYCDCVLHMVGSPVTGLESEKSGRVSAE
ncbi:MAG: ATP-binding cassette domain-containing protein [Clostridia bacterium]|nr:ATP-binding cassette domain-containing protein [Clostridia bacterium]